MISKLAAGVCPGFPEPGQASGAPLLTNRPVNDLLSRWLEAQGDPATSLIRLVRQPFTLQSGDPLVENAAAIPTSIVIPEVFFDRRQGGGRFRPEAATGGKQGK